MKILILSPHRDDAAFSLSLAITNWLTARHTVTILNIFTRSRFAPYSDAAFVHENDELSYVSAMRLREDELWVRRIKESLPKGHKNNLHIFDLNLKDAPIRLRIPLEAVNTTPVNPADPSIEKIRKALTRQSVAGNLEALVLPLALGNHVDHLTVREAALPLTTGSNAIPSAFYEDLPYAAAYPSVTDLDHILEVTTTLGEPLVPTQSSFNTPETAAEATARKRHLALGYASQIDEEAADAIANFATRYNGAERLWLNQQWLSTFTSTDKA